MYVLQTCPTQPVRRHQLRLTTCILFTPSMEREGEHSLQLRWSLQCMGQPLIPLQTRLIGGKCTSEIQEAANQHQHLPTKGSLLFPWFLCKKYVNKLFVKLSAWSVSYCKWTPVEWTLGSIFGEVNRSKCLAPYIRYSCTAGYRAWMVHATWWIDVYATNIIPLSQSPQYICEGGQIEFASPWQNLCTWPTGRLKRFSVYSLNATSNFF